MEELSLLQMDEQGNSTSIKLLLGKFNGALKFVQAVAFNGYWLSVRVENIESF